MRKLFILLVLNLMAALSWSQTKQIDSLKHTLISEENPRIYFRTLHKISALYQEMHLYDSSKRILQRMLTKSLESNNDSLIFGAYLNLGSIFDREGDFYHSLNYGIKALKIAESLKSETYQSIILNNIAWAYTQMGDYRKGIDNSIRSTQLALKNDEEEFAFYNYVLASNNAAIGYMGLNQTDSALFFNRQANMANKKLNEAMAQMWILAEFVEIYQSLNQLDSVQYYFQQCIALKDTAASQVSGMDQGVVFASLFYSRLLNNLSQYPEAEKIASDGFILGKRIDYRRYLIDLAGELSRSYEGLGLIDSAYKYARIENELKDSVFSQRQSVQIQNLIVDKEIRGQENKHQNELAQKNRNRNILLGIGLLAILLSFSMYSRVRFIRKANRQISKEKDRSDNLLLNILPADIAAELKANGKAEARDFDLVSILFTDFKEFTQTSEKLTAQELVSEINTCFEAFDTICEKYKVEKIKTIGDSYMGAGGLPVPTEDSVKNTVMAALEMQSFIVARHKSQVASGLPAFEMRVGIHTGPVVAGIVGVKKFQYDIWGDTVNTASRMESAGEVGKVNISQATYELLQDGIRLPADGATEGRLSLPAAGTFEFESRGKVEAKGKGEVEMFFVHLST